MSLYREIRKVNRVAEVNWGCESNFVKASYSILEIVALSHGSRKVNTVAEVNGGCESKFCKGLLFDIRHCDPLPRKLKIK